MERHPHILNASSNLLGFAFIVIGALKLTHSNAKSFGDESAWISTALFLVAILSSYWAIRRNATTVRLNIIADIGFFGGLLFLTASLLIAATSEI